MMHKYQSSGLLLLLLFILAGCTVQFVSDYDARTERSVSRIRVQLSKLFFALEAQVGKRPDCTYQSHSEKYEKLRVELDLMMMRERTKPKNQKTSDQVEVLDKGLRKLQKTHKRDCLNHLQITLINQTLTGILDSILRFETAKLRGARKPAPLPAVR